jgi:prepilin-type N-terminal cleavage/methylation domain-containing protein
MKTGRSNRSGMRQGFTLIEVMVALGLFGLIAVAGFTLLDGVIGTRDRLDGRLGRTAELQRAMYLVTLDFEAMTEGPLQVSGTTVAFRRRSPVAIGGSTEVRYLLMNKALHRQVGADVDQTLVSGVEALEWSFHTSGQGWTAQPPPANVAVVPGQRVKRPTAIAMTLRLAESGDGLNGSLRRVVDLPVQP